MGDHGLNTEVGRNIIRKLEEVWNTQGHIIFSIKVEERNFFCFMSYFYQSLHSSNHQLGCFLASLLMPLKIIFPFFWDGFKSSLVHWGGCLLESLKMAITGKKHKFQMKDEGYSVLSVCLSYDNDQATREALKKTCQTLTN